MKDARFTHKKVHSTRTTIDEKRGSMADQSETLIKPPSKKEQARHILMDMKANSTLKRSTAVKKFQDELGVTNAYAATLWQSLKDSV